MLIVDATFADQMIAYPTDLGLIARSREKSERIIDEHCRELDIKDKPQTYRRIARRQYLNVAKKKNKRKNELHKAIGVQLRYLRRNLKSINGLLDKSPGMSFPLARDQRILEHL
jgi:transposase, IS5 family